MTDERDVWRAAKLMIDQHGDKAPIEAALRVDKMMDIGDQDGHAVWKAILKAVTDLVNKKPDRTVH